MAAKLTDKQRAFVAEYLVDLNGTQAAIRAGYSAKTAGAIGDENLRKPAIAKAVELEQAKRAERVEIDQDYVLSNLVEVTERGRESIHYQTGRTIVEDLVKRGLLMVIPSGCCRKEYFPTAIAQKLMEGGGSKL